MRFLSQWASLFGALKELGSEGKITSGELIKALDLIEAEVDANLQRPFRPLRKLLLFVANR